MEGNIEFSTSDIIAIVTGSLGFIISVYNLILSHYRNKPKLDLFIENITKTDVLLTVNNPSNKLDKLNSITLKHRASGKKVRWNTFIGSASPIPYNFKVGDSITYPIELKKLRAQFGEEVKSTDQNELDVLIKDGFGREYKIRKAFSVKL